MENIRSINHGSTTYKDKHYYDCITKVIASFVSALPESERRGALASALRLVAQDDALRDTRSTGSSLVFPVLAIPDDADVSSVINLVSGMGATILAVGQARPTTTAREIMEIADTMMGRRDLAFSGDPVGIGMPIASAIAAAVSSDPELLTEVQNGGFGKMIAEISRAYDCVAHKGPLSMVELPQQTVPLNGGLFNSIMDMFTDSPLEKVEKKTANKLENLTDKNERISNKISDIQAEIAETEAKLAAATDIKTTKKLQRKLARLKWKLGKKEAKQEKVKDKIAEWNELSDELHDDAPVVDPNAVTKKDPTEHGLGLLVDDSSAQSVSAMMSALTSAGVDERLASLISGYLVSNGVNDGVTYLSRLGQRLSLDIPNAARYVAYLASGLTHSQALELVTSGSAEPRDITDMISDVQNRNDAYRAVLQEQMARLRAVNDSATTATRLYVRAEWADAMMSCTDDVADILAKVAPDASSTASFLASIISLVAAAKLEGSASSALLSEINSAVAKGTMAPEAAYLFTGDPTFIPALVVAVNPPSASPDVAGGSSADNGSAPNPMGAEPGNPVLTALMSRIGS
jgi:hypothetical protein